MDVVIAGGHGQIALHLTRLLAGRADRVRGIIRNPDHAAELQEAGAEPVVLDLEEASVADLAARLEGADAFVFAAGAGPGSGDARKETMDKGGAVKGVEACEQAGVGRYVIVSAIGAGKALRQEQQGDDDGMGVYMRAKAEADEAVMASSLSWTVVRPGHLTDGAPTGAVMIAAEVDYADVDREDVAAVLAAVLATPSAVGKAFEVIGGDTPVDDAVAGL